MKVSVSALLIFSLLLCSAFLDIAHAYSSPPMQSPPGVPSFCSSKCTYRCSRNYMHKMCMKMCMICCGKCNCVPKGPYAPKSQCPCYRDMTNKKGKPKCP